LSESSTTNEIMNGSGLNLAAAAHVFPPYREGTSVNPSTIYRWITTGVRLPDGSQLRLEARRIGGRWLTSREAIQRFIEAQTPRFEDHPAPQPHTSTRAAKAAEQAGRELDRVGI
jgi:hypothetical protein